MFTANEVARTKQPFHAQRRAGKRCSCEPEQALSRDGASLFLFAGAEGRLPTGRLLTWRRCDHLDLLFLWLLLLAIASLLAFGHNDLLLL
jgi:hypothetical protein